MVCPACAEAKAKAESPVPEPEIAADSENGRTPRPESVQIVPASHMLRFLAYFIDKIILQITMGVFCFVFFGASLLLMAGQAGLTGGSRPQLPEVLGIFGLVFVFLLLMPLVIYALFEQSRWQGTPGKIFMRLAVTDLNGERLTFSRALIRNAFRWIGVLPLFLALFVFLTTKSFSELIGLSILSLVLSLLTYLWIFLNPEHQGLHDRFSGCVVQEKGVVPLWRVLTSTLVIACLILYGIFSRATTKHVDNNSGPKVSSYRSIGPISK